MSQDMKMYAYILGDSRETSAPKSKTLVGGASVIYLIGFPRQTYILDRQRYIAAEKNAGAMVRQHI